MKIEPTFMANHRRIALKVTFENSDYLQLSADNPNKSYMELYEDFHEFKTHSIHDLITCEPYKNKWILLTVIDHVYELWHDIVIDATKHVSDRSICQFCTLDHLLEC